LQAESTGSPTDSSSPGGTPILLMLYKKGKNNNLTIQAAATATTTSETSNKNNGSDTKESMTPSLCESLVGWKLKQCEYNHSHKKWCFKATA
jgi:hypothetical protein